MSTYYAEADHLHREYTRAVGYALQYGILTYYFGSGAPAKALGTLRDEIRAHERARGITDGMCPPPPLRAPSSDVQAYCYRGHPMTAWGGPMVGRAGDEVRWWASPFLCHCGSGARYGRRHLR